MTDNTDGVEFLTLSKVNAAATSDEACEELRAHLIAQKEAFFAVNSYRASSNSSSASPIQRLPLELLVDIFRWLPIFDLNNSVPHVCKVWYAASLSPLLRLRLELVENAPWKKAIMLVLKRPALRLLRGRSLEHADTVLPLAVKLSTFLVCLDIGFCRLGENEAILLASNLPATLLHLNVEAVSNIELNFITTLVQRCPRLEALSLSHCAAVCDTCVRELCKGLPHLSVLNLDGIMWLSDDSLRYLSKSSFVQQRTLTSLWLDGVKFTPAGFTAFFETLTVPRPRAHLPASGLRILSISFCEQLDDHLSVLLSRLTGLKSLTLRKAERMTENGLCTLFHSNEQHPFLGLEFLDLSEAPGMTDAVVKNICFCCGTSLRTLLLNWCTELTDQSLEEIVHNCPYLRHLSLVGAHRILGDVLLEVPVKLSHLFILNLTQCNNISCVLLETLAHRMPELYLFDYFGERVGATVDNICHFDITRIIDRVTICGH